MFTLSNGNMLEISKLSFLHSCPETHAFRCMLNFDKRYEMPPFVEAKLLFFFNFKLGLAFMLCFTGATVFAWSKEDT